MSTRLHLHDDPSPFRLLATTLVLTACACVFAGVARADDGPSAVADTSADATRLDRVEVTGSRIRRIDGETALPVQILRREDIERSGAQSTEQLLSQITANVGSVPVALSIGGVAPPGFSGASLRGLGSTRTLVLVDGRRLANYAFADQSGSGVDLHAIPLEAVERVEVLKDGASAIYGSDAIGGVINFILKTDFRGATASVYRGMAQGGGAAETRSTATIGGGDLAVDRFNWFAVVDIHRTDGLGARDRAFASTAYRPDANLVSISNSSFPANIGLGHNRFANPAAPACTDDTVFLRGGCGFDAPKIADLLPPTEQSSVFTRGSFAIDATHTAYLEALTDRSRVRAVIAPTPVAFLSTDGDPIVLPASSPFYPTGLGLSGDLTDIRYRTGALGPRVTESVAVQSRVLVGTKGGFGDWNYDTAVVYNVSRATDRYVSGFVNQDAIANALGTGLVNPFGDSGPTGDALLASTQASGVALRGVGITRGLDFHASRDLFALPGGPASIALGLEARRESLDYQPTLLGTTSASAFEGTPTAGRRSTRAAYVELSLPVVKTVDAQLALREDRYSDFGATRNPKVALRWQPLRGLMFRASYGRGFRAPSLPELFTAQVGAIGEYADPVRCPVTGTDADCAAIVDVRTGGNPASLKPERSEQRSAGLVFEPSTHWSVSLDYWHIRLTNQIAALDADYVLANDAVYEGTNIVRGPADPTTPGLPGPITDLVLLNQNLGAIHTHGLDVELALHSGPTAFGRFDAHLSGTYTQEAQEQLGFQQFVDARAKDAGGFVVPRWQQYLSLGWSGGPWTASVHEQLQTGYRETNAAGDTRHVGNDETWGAQLSFAGIPHATLTLGLDNVFNRAPPFTFQTDFSQVGYNPRVADPRGRFWYAKLVGRFE